MNQLRLNQSKIYSQHSEGLVYLLLKRFDKKVYAIWILGTIEKEMIHGLNPVIKPLIVS